MSTNTSGFTRGELIHTGKANDVYKIPEDPFHLELDSTDRISAGDGAKRDVIEGKGKVNNQVSMAIFGQIDEAGIPTHFVCPGTTESSKIVRKAKMIPLEVIGRFKTCGSFCKRYGCESMIPINPMGIEFCLKNDDLHDPFIPKYAIETLDILDSAGITLIEEYTEKIGQIMFDSFDQLGLELIDFKIEFGFDEESGDLILCDEISPDTCRLLDKVTGESMDKDRFRKDMGNVQDGYLGVLARLKNQS